MSSKEELFAHLDKHGYVVLKGVLTVNQVGALRERSIELIKKERELGAQLYLDNRSQRVWNLVNKGKIFADMIQHPSVLEFQEYLLGNNCTLSSFTVNLIGPGSPVSGLHIDYPLSNLPTPHPSFALCANSVYLLDDFSLENGATRLIPGSHKRGYGPSPGEMYDDVIQVTGKKGDIIIVHGHIWHSSGENHTDRDRVALLGFFCRSFMKPQQDHLKLIATDIIEEASPTLKRLLGMDSQPNLND
ncbi:MAG: phytanoyl-CoA dioxygenase family protein [Candidatus Poribacteria bacterium]